MFPIHAELAGILFQPTDGAFRVDDVNAFVCLAIWQMVGLSPAHLEIGEGVS
jgi:hypothetical protein